MWKLQQGRYIPKVSGIGHQVGLAKDVLGSLEGLDKGKEFLNKYRSNLQTAGGIGKGIFGKIAGFASKKGLDMLTKTAFGTTPLGMIAGVGGKMLFDRAMKHGGGEFAKKLAKKFGFAKAPEIAARGKFGLHTDEYKKLSEAPDKIESELTGASEGEALGGLSLNELWRNLPGGKESAGNLLERAGIQTGIPSAIGKAKASIFGSAGAPLPTPESPNIAGAESYFNNPMMRLTHGAEEMAPDVAIPDDSSWNVFEDYSNLSSAPGESDIWAGGADWPEYTGNELGFQIEQPSQQGGYMQGYQGGGEARGALMRAFESADLNRDKIMGEASERQRVEKSGLEEMLGLAGEMKQEDIYQKSLMDMDKGNLKSLLGLVGGAKDKALTRYGDSPSLSMNEPLEPLGGLSGEELAPESAKERFMWGRLPKDVGIMDKYWEMAQENPYEDIVSNLEFGTRQPDRRGTLTDLLFPTEMQTAVQEAPFTSEYNIKDPMGLQEDKPTRHGRSTLSQLLESKHPMFGMQIGGMMPGGVSNALPYNIGGSVQQQPMAYQLGGLLKYKRSPMMG